MTGVADRLFHLGGVPVGGPLLGLLGDGEAFFVDPGMGSDGNRGTTIDKAFQTMDRAFEFVVADRGDMIIRLPGTETVTAELLITKAGAVVVASTSAWSPPGGRGAGAEYYLMWGPALTDAPVIHQRESTSWLGLSFANASTGATENGAGINIANEVAGDQGGFCYVISCEFPAWGSNNSGIYLHGGSHVLIARNSFGGASGTLPVGVAFGGSATSNPVNDIIDDNIFNNITEAIKVYDGTPQDVQIINNFFHDCAEAIDANGGGGNAFVAGNHFDEDTGTDCFDDTVGNLETAGWRFAGNKYKADA